MRVNEIKNNTYSPSIVKYTNINKNRVLNAQTIGMTSFGDSFEKSKGEMQTSQTPFWSKVTHAVGSFWKGGENINIPFESVLYYPY